MAGLIPSCAWGVFMCTEPKHAWETRELPWLYPLFTAELGSVADQCLGARVRRRGCRMGCTSPEPAKPARAPHPAFEGEGEGGCTLSHSSTQVWLHLFVLQPKPGGDAKPTL